MSEIDLMSPVIRHTVLLLISIGYLIGSWVADDETDRQHRVLLFWILIIGAGVNASIADVIEALPK